MAETSKRKQRGPGSPFTKGVSGNPRGKPVGTKNYSTRLVESLVEGQAEGLVNKTISLALEGDVTALRICLDRLCPVRKERPLSLALPHAATAAELPKLTSAIIEAVGSGVLEPGQVSALSGLVAAHGRSLMLAELEGRISILENALKGAEYDPK